MIRWWSSSFFFTDYSLEHATTYYSACRDSMAWMESLPPSGWRGLLGALRATRVRLVLPARFFGVHGFSTKVISNNQKPGVAIPFVLLLSFCYSFDLLWAMSIYEYLCCVCCFGWRLYRATHTGPLTGSRFLRELYVPRWFAALSQRHMRRMTLESIFGLGPAKDYHDVPRVWQSQSIQSSQRSFSTSFVRRLPPFHLEVAQSKSIATWYS